MQKNEKAAWRETMKSSLGEPSLSSLLSLSPSAFLSPPPPPNTIKTANEGRFRLNGDSPYGERAQSTVLTRAPLRRPARPRRDFIFNLSMRES